MRAEAVKKRWTYRLIRVSTDEGEFMLEFRYHGIGTVTIKVNDEVVIDTLEPGNYSLTKDLSYEFTLGSLPVRLDAQLWPWGRYRSFRLEVDRDELYAE